MLKSEQQPDKIRLVHYKDDSFTRQVTVLDENGDAFDLTGYTIGGGARVDPESTSNLFDWSVVVVDNVITFTKSSAYMDTLDYGTFWWDLYFTIGGTKEAQIGGELIKTGLARKESNPTITLQRIGASTITLIITINRTTVTTTNNYTNFKTNVAMLGTKDGVNDTFTIDADAIIANTESIIFNGITLVRGVDYSILLTEVVLLISNLPVSGDYLVSNHIEA